MFKIIVFVFIIFLDHNMTYGAFKNNEKVSDINLIKQVAQNFEIIGTKPLFGLGISQRLRRAAVRNREKVWPFGIIPYEIDPIFSTTQKALFLEAMRHWENYTCIQFVERLPQQDGHKDYILFTIKPCGCCSYAGRRRTGAQEISIGRNCDKFGIVVHELSHAIGFYHEHTRPDRDEHVTIAKENIIRGQESNFDKLPDDDVDSLGMPYDFGSITHYAGNTFSKSVYLDTIVPIKVNGQKIPAIGQRVELSAGDILQANILYNCPSCGRTFQDAFGLIESSYYATTVSNKAYFCEWRIIAASGEKIMLSILELNLKPDCSQNYVEIRDGYGSNSILLSRLCGDVTSTIQTIQSKFNRMLIRMGLQATTIGKEFTANYRTICGGQLENNGNLQSPNYPSNYLPNKECLWQISVPVGYKVALKFKTFDIEPQDHCLYDYVEVRDGSTPDANLIGKYCGSRVPADLLTHTNEMLVKFVSDDSTQNLGFSAIFLMEIDECQQDNHGCSHDCRNTLGSYHCDCPVGYELRSDAKSCDVGCGGRIESTTNGTITSPSFGENYPKQCTWEIKAPENHRIKVMFIDLEIENNECAGIKIYSKFSNLSTAQEHDDFCKRRTKIPQIFSASNLLQIEFHPNKTATSFSVLFFIEKDTCSINNGGCAHNCISLGADNYKCLCRNGYVLEADKHNCTVSCLFDINTSTGEISSPNYPNNYKPMTDCIWNFRINEGHRFLLKFIEFDLEVHEECAFDFVEIYAGNSTVQQFVSLERKLCGNRLPSLISTPSNEMFMLFQSDENNQRQGFLLNFNSECGGRLIAFNFSKKIYSHPEYGLDNQNRNLNCEWIIETADSDFSNIHLRFLILSLHDNDEDDLCLHNYIEIFDGSNDYSGRFHGRFCGKTLPHDIVSMSNTLFVRFRSEGSTISDQQNQFTLEYFSIENLTEYEPNKEDDVDESGAFVTPFPGYI